jgi:hypothetical protein
MTKSMHNALGEKVGTIDITPLPHMLLGQRHTDISWSTCLCEIIDNAFDASASVVEMIFGTDSLEVRDNGTGCADLAAMLTLGDHADHRETILGRFGWGLKDAAIALGDKIDIVSVHEGVERFLTCNWRTLEQATTWRIAAPTIRPTTAPSGTSILISSNLKKRRSTPDLLDKLGLIYMPALLSGKQIRWKVPREKSVNLVTPFAFPPLEHARTETLSVQGKTATVTMGLVLPQQPGVQYHKCLGLMQIYGYRVLDWNTRLGLGEAATPGLFGTVTFDTAWQLTKNKNGLAEAKDDLERQIAVAFKDVIERAVVQGQALPFQQAQQAVNQAMETLLQRPTREGWVKGARPGPPRKKGTRTPTGAGSPHRHATVIQNGTRFKAPLLGANEGPRIAFTSLGHDRLWEVSDNLIYFNTDSPVIQALRQHELALQVCASAQLAYQLVAKPQAQQLLLPGILKDLENHDDYRDRLELCQRHILTKLVQ